jgi:hypothetical protein
VANSSTASYIVAGAYKNSDDKIKVEVWDVVDRVWADEAEGTGVAVDDDAPAGTTATYKLEQSI